MGGVVQLRAQRENCCGPAEDVRPIVVGATEPWARPLPVLGGAVFIEFPTDVSGPDAAVLYRVVDVDRRGNLTAEAVVGLVPAVRAESPCIVRYRRGTDEVAADALALSASRGTVILRLNMADARRHPRSALEVGVSIEVPGTGHRAMIGTTEEVSLGGLRARLPACLPVDRRAFVSLHPSATPPIAAIAVIASCDPGTPAGWYVARLEYTLMAPTDQARLWSLVESPLHRSEA
jgi:PilZ domain-containing protein